jgi:SAM-dependent methyltransferase
MSCDNSIKWFVDELSFFRGLLWIRGWAFHPAKRITELGCIFPEGTYQSLDSYGQRSDDVEAVYGPAARNCRFSSCLGRPSSDGHASIQLAFTLEGGERLSASNLVGQTLEACQPRRMEREFYAKLAERPGGNILEIGSRNVTGALNRNNVPPSWKFVGMDILPDAYTDVVGDAHDLRKHFRRNSFDAVISTAVFEHLIMPWKAVLEINRVLRQGGLVFVMSHQTFPMHGEPWDYFRFSTRAWRALFNRRTGFEILETGQGMPASIVAHQLMEHTTYLPDLPAYILTAVLARKIGPTRLRWDVKLDDIEDRPVPT